MKVLLSALALATATQVITGIGQYISLGFELSRCCAYWAQGTEACIAGARMMSPSSLNH